jgi:hypothetical protein
MVSRDETRLALVGAAVSGASSVVIRGSLQKAAMMTAGMLDVLKNS